MLTEERKLKNNEKNRMLVQARLPAPKKRKNKDIVVLYIKSVPFCIQYELSFKNRSFSKWMHLMQNFLWFKNLQQLHTDFNHTHIVWLYLYTTKHKATIFFLNGAMRATPISKCHSSTLRENLVVTFAEPLHR
jgi:hypothetical protein